MIHRIPVAETGLKPPYDCRRVLTFWLLYDWESREKRLLLEPPPSDYRYRDNEKLYRCQLEMDPPNLNGTGEISIGAEALFEEDNTTTPVKEEDAAYHIARYFFCISSRACPKGTFISGAESEKKVVGYSSRWGKPGDFNASEFTMSCFGGTFRVSVEKVDGSPADQKGV